MNKSVSKKQCEADPFSFCAIGHLNGVIQIVDCVGDSVSAFGDGEIFYATNQAI